MGGSKTRAQIIKTTRRRAFVMARREAGYNYREIAEAALRRFGEDELPKGWDARYAYKDVMRELRKVQEELAETRENVRHLELQRIDRLFTQTYQIAGGVKRGVGTEMQLKAVDRCIKLMRRRDKLLGLDAPDELLLRGEIRVTADDIREAREQARGELEDWREENEGETATE